MEEFEKNDGRVHENLGANMTQSEREVYIRRLLLETAFIEEQLKNLGDEELEVGKNYGVFTLKEFYGMHPEFFEGIDPGILDNPEFNNELVACMGEDSYVLISNGMIAAKSENGNFELSEEMRDIIEEKKNPLEEMTLLNEGGRVSEEYMAKYMQNYNSELLKENLPQDMQEYFKQLTDGDLVITRERFRDTIGMTEEDRAYLDEKLREKEHEIEEAEEQFVDNEISEDELKKIIESVKGGKDEKGNDNTIDKDTKSIEELEEERAMKIASAVLKRYKVPVEARDSLVKFFLENEDVDMDSLKQVMEIKLADEAQNTGYALRFRSNSPSVTDRIVVWQDNRIIDKRMYDEDIERRMDEQYTKEAPTEILSSKDHQLVYTDMSGKTFVAPLRRTQPKDLTDKEAIDIINEFESLRSKEQEILNSKDKYEPDEAISRLTQAKKDRLELIKSYGLEVPEIEAEINADREISEEVEDKVNAKREEFIERKEAEEAEKEEAEEEDKNKDDNDDWVRGPYDPYHGMRPH